MTAPLTIQDAHKLAKSRGFKFLSSEYYHAKTKYLWQCSKRHKWNCTYDNIKRGSGCPDCAGNKPKTIQDAHNLAQSRGFIFLSNKFRGVLNKYSWGCNEGHNWSARFTDVQKGDGCPDCSIRRKTTIQDAQNLAKNRGFKFLSIEFKNTSTKYPWQCSHGHEWNTNYNRIHNGWGCPHCACLAPKNIKYVHEIAGSRGFKFLSLEYKNSRIKYLWRCQQGHEWMANFNSVANQGTGCPDCAGTKLKTIKDAHNLAESRGFKFLSNEFRGVLHKYSWGCKKGHQWLAQYSNIQNGTGCPICLDRFKGEKLTRYVFEKMLLCDFKKMKPDWMRNYKTGRRLELDGFNVQMGIAFEHQGKQHEMDCLKSHRFYDSEQLVRDEIKRQKCKEQGITLIEVPEIGRRLKVKDIVPFLLSEFDKHNIAYPESAKNFKIDMKEFYAQYMNEKSTTPRSF